MILKLLISHSHRQRAPLQRADPTSGVDGRDVWKMFEMQIRVIDQAIEGRPI